MKNNRSKSLLLVLIMSLVLSSLTGCYVTPTGEVVLLSANAISDNQFLMNQMAEETVADEQEEQDSDEADAQNSAEAEDEVTAVSDDEADVTEHTDTEAYTLEYIAELNEIDVAELNVSYDEDGYITFLGNKYCEDTIKSEEDALASLEYIRSLIGLNDTELQFYSAEESAASGYKYYIFYKQSDIELDGESVAAIDYDNMVKIIVNSSDEVAGISACINHDGNSMLTVSQASEDEDYFKHMAEAGEFTYSLSADWIKAAYPDYAGDEKLEVTVPVMYDKSRSTYCLGDVNRRIVVVNAYDYKAEDYVINAVITDTPNDVESWHYDNALMDEEAEYFCDTDYIIASYDAFIRAYDLFEDKYDLSRAGAKSYMLGVYGCGDEYPNKESGFSKSIGHYELLNGHGYVSTSPMLAECLNTKYIARELVTAMITDMIPVDSINQHGALLEAYADILGIKLADIYDENMSDNPWKLGGTYSAMVKDISAPTLSLQPELVGGLYYVDEVEAEYGPTTDCGGVHTNSSIPNFLAYNMVMGSANKSANEQVLTDEEVLNVWLESLYMLSKHSDFEDEAHYLELAMDICNIEDNQKNYVKRLLSSYGFMGETADAVAIFDEEDYKLVSVNIIDEEESFLDDYVITAKLTTADGRVAGTTVIRESASEFKYALTDDMLLTMSIYDADSAEVISNISTSTMAKAITTEGFSIALANVGLEAGSSFSIPENEEITELDDNCVKVEKSLLLDKCAVFNNEGEYFLMTRSIDDEAGEYVMYHIAVE